MKQKERLHRKKPTKADCKYHDVGYCHKYHDRCFDCREYKFNDNYIRKDGSRWSHIV